MVTSTQEENFTWEPTVPHTLWTSPTCCQVSELGSWGRTNFSIHVGNIKQRWIAYHNTVSPTMWWGLRRGGSAYYCVYVGHVGIAPRPSFNIPFFPLDFSCDNEEQFASYWQSFDRNVMTKYGALQWWQSMLPDIRNEWGNISQTLDWVCDLLQQSQTSHSFGWWNGLMN